MSNDLFEPSLTRENYREIKTYQISRILYVAFLGGVIPTVVLGSRNAKWLQIDKKMIGLMMILGIAILFFKPLFVGLATVNYIKYEVRSIRWIYNVACVLLYLGYYFLMKEKFKQHIVTGGEIRPILKDAVIWSVAGMLIEFGLVITGIRIIEYVL